MRKTLVKRPTKDHNYFKKFKIKTFDSDMSSCGGASGWMDRGWGLWYGGSGGSVTDSGSSEFPAPSLELFLNGSWKESLTPLRFLTLYNSNSITGFGMTLVGIFKCKIHI